MTSAAFIGLTIYAFKTKTDFTMYYGVLFGMSIALLCAVILTIFIQSKPLMMLITGVVTCVSMIFIIVDTQMIVQKGKYNLS